MGRSGALVLRGEAGIGKTALLDYAAEHAESMTVVRALGVESEAQLEFSGLLELCWPLRDALDELPEHQAGVLRSALGIAPAEEHDRFRSARPRSACWPRPPRRIQSASSSTTLSGSTRHRRRRLSSRRSGFMRTAWRSCSGHAMARNRRSMRPVSSRCR